MRNILVRVIQWLLARIPDSVLNYCEQEFSRRNKPKIEAERARILAEYQLKKQSLGESLGFLKPNMELVKERRKILSTFTKEELEEGLLTIEEWNSLVVDNTKEIDSTFDPKEFNKELRKKEIADNGNRWSTPKMAVNEKIELGKETKFVG